MLDMLDIERQESHGQSSRRRSLYRRDLPGAGYVAIDLSEPDAESPDELGRIRVYVERRASKERRAGHEPPVIAEVRSDDTAQSLADLYRMAADNVALARGLLEWQARRRHSGEVPPATA